MRNRTISEGQQLHYQITVRRKRPSRWRIVQVEKSDNLTQSAAPIIHFNPFAQENTKLPCGF